jgi:hypothetical protein
MKKIVLVFLCSLLFGGLSAQDSVRLIVGSQLDITRLNVPTTAYDSLLKVLEGAVNTYQTLGNFYDPVAGMPAPQAADAFRALHKPSAQLLADYREETRQAIGITEYCRELTYYFADEGFRFAVRRAELTDLWWDTLYNNKYLATLVLDKEAFNRLSPMGQPKAVPAGRGLYQLLLQLEISPDLAGWQIREATAYRPTGGETMVVDDYSTYLSLQAAGTRWLPVYNTQPLWAQATGARLTHTAGPAYALGLQLATNRWLPRSKGAKSWYLLLGVFYGQQSLRTDMQDYAVTVQAVAGGLPFERQGSGIRATEELTISNLGIPLGLGWSFRSGFTTRWMLEAVLLPSLVLAADASIEANGDYVGRVMVGGQDVLLPGAPGGRVTRPGNEELWENEYGLGRGLQASLMPEPTTAAGLWLRLSPAVSIDFNSRNPALGMLLALDAAFNLRPQLQEQPYAELPLGRMGELPGNLSTGWLSDLRHHSLGLRLGLYYHFRKSNN